MTDNTSTLNELDKDKAPVRPAVGLDTHETLKAMAAANTLPKDTISNALRAVLETQGRLNEFSQIANVPGAQMREAINAALGPSKAIKAAMAALPSASLQQAVQQLPVVSVPKVHSLPTAPGMQASLTLQKERSDLHVLRDVAELGKAVRNARKAKGLTQQKFADLAGVGRRFVSDLEQGKQTLEIGKALKVASAAGIQLTFNAIVSPP